MNHLDVYDPLIVTFLLFLPVLNHPSPLELFVYLRLIIGILSLCISAHLTVLPLVNPVFNLTFSLLPIMSSQPHASASDSTFDFWCYVNIWLTLTFVRANNESKTYQTISTWEVLLLAWRPVFRPTCGIWTQHTQCTHQDQEQDIIFLS